MQLQETGVSCRGEKGERIYPRRRYFSGGDQPAIFREDAGRTFPNLPRAARAESFAVSFLFATERRGGSGQLPGDAGEVAEADIDLPADSGNAAGRERRSRRRAPCK